MPVEASTFFFKLEKLRKNGWPIVVAIILSLNNYTYCRELSYTNSIRRVESEESAVFWGI